uniref:Uncharacterized protein n=1 Tax=Cacopsylla melanoneura TaxID=428564 RepID=A0A8D8WCA4_9HEMI
MGKNAGMFRREVGKQQGKENCEMGQEGSLNTRVGRNVEEWNVCMGSGKKMFSQHCCMEFQFRPRRIAGAFYLSIFIVFLHHQFPFVSSCCSFVPPFSFC